MKEMIFGEDRRHFSWCEPHGAGLWASVHLHEGNRRAERHRVPLSREGAVEAKEGVWRYAIDGKTSELGGDRFSFRARLESGRSPATTVGLEIEFGNWNEKVWVLMPGAVVAGNRFPVVAEGYPPMPPPRAVREGSAPPGISRVPRLSFESGPSRLEQLSSDPSLPAIGFFFPETVRGLWILTPQKAGDHLIGFELEENEERNRATLRIEAPGLRHGTCYSIGDDRNPSEEVAPDFEEGATLEWELLVKEFECTTVQGLYDALVPLRNALVPPAARPALIPFSACFDILEEKMATQNWIENPGYHSVGVPPMRDASIHQDWQIGWVGGGITTFALLLRGNSESRAKALRELDFLFGPAQHASGWFHPVMKGGVEVHGDHFADTSLPWLLTRKSADALYYLSASLLLLIEREGDCAVASRWRQGVRRAADAFVATWNRYGQFGQFVDYRDGTILVEGTASAAIAPAGLVLAARLVPERAEFYLRVARDAGAHFDVEYLRKGMTWGGPGDAVQGPDSESVAGLLESFMRLHEVDGDPQWLDSARRAGIQAASWVVPFDFAFPPESTFAKMGMHAAGTVLANVQNKHSAPGICTHSGQSLLRLSRASGDPFFLDLLRDIAHSLPQFMSREDRPIPFKIPYNRPVEKGRMALEPGWMCERVNLTRWGEWELPGEVFYYSCWSEVSLLLTVAELPGVVAQPDTGRIWCLDHVEARWGDARREELVLSNPTRFRAKTRVLHENSGGSVRIPLDFLAGLPCVTMEPGETKRMRVGAT